MNHQLNSPKERVYRPKTRGENAGRKEKEARARKKYRPSERKKERPYTEKKREKRRASCPSEDNRRSKRMAEDTYIYTRERRRKRERERSLTREACDSRHCQRETRPRRAIKHLAARRIRQVPSGWRSRLMHLRGKLRARARVPLLSRPRELHLRGSASLCYTGAPGLLSRR